MQQRVSPPNQGVETPAFLGSRRVSLSVAALQEAGGQATEEPDLAVERLVERGPEMFMDPAEEESARKVALGKCDGCCGARPKRIESGAPTRDFESPFQRVSSSAAG